MSNPFLLPPNTMSANYRNLYDFNQLTSPLPKDANDPDNQNNQNTPYAELTNVDVLDLAARQAKRFVH